jgi:phenylpropionate dioxygenase-like ring-hydroxylating dioxygenase large terminal subunit
MFLCHVNDVKLNSYLVLKQFNSKKVIVKTNDGYKLVSNVCPHQQSLLTTCNGRGGRVCPYHGWSFDIDGNNLGSGTTTNCSNDIPLETEPVYEWNNLLFSAPVDYDYQHDLSNMELVETRVDTVHADYRNVVDLFLDVDHIPLIHKGVYEEIGLSNITSVNWEFFSNGSMQFVERKDTSYN